MIGHYLLALDREAEDRILTTRLSPGAYYHRRESVWLDKRRTIEFAIQPGDRCLVGAAANWSDGTRGLAPQFVEVATWASDTCDTDIMVEEQYDGLCERFGPERINRVIRQRILMNRFWREMMVPGLRARKAWLEMVSGEVLQEA